MGQWAENGRAMTAAAIDTAVDNGQYLTFMSNGEVFGVDIVHTKEIIEYGDLTTVPLMPGFIRGVINLRGSVVAVVDLAARFGGRPSAVTKRTCIVIVELESDEGILDIGLIVDSVVEVVDISAADIQPAPSFGTCIRTDFIDGMGKLDEHLVVLLNVAKVLSVAELAQVGTVAGREGDMPVPH